MFSTTDGKQVRYLDHFIPFKYRTRILSEDRMTYNLLLST